MKRPSFQFYPADWRNNAKLRRCSDAARGAWMDVLSVLHDSDEYGVVRWPLADLARAAGVSLKLVRELADKDVLKGADAWTGNLIFTPTHAGKKGDPITLVRGDGGPCWFSSRFVRDEWIRHRRGEGSRFDADNQPPKSAPKSSPTRPVGERQGDGPTSSSSSSSTSSKEDTSLRSVEAAKAKIEIPDWIPPEAWAGFVEMRKKIRAPLTERGTLLIIASLGKMRATDDIGAVLDQSTMHNWKGVFHVKHEASNGQARKSSAHDRFNEGVGLFLQSLGPDVDRSGESEVGDPPDRPSLPLLAS